MDKIISGNRFKSKSSTGILQIRPATKQPMGTVIMPQIRPKKSSLYLPGFTIPSEKGIVNEITQPIIDVTIKALKLPITSVLHTACARGEPPISFAKTDAGIIDGSIPKTL